MNTTEKKQLIIDKWKEINKDISEEDIDLMTAEEKVQYIKVNLEIEKKLLQLEALEKIEKQKKGE